MVVFEEPHDGFLLTWEHLHRLRQSNLTINKLVHVCWVCHSYQMVCISDAKLSGVNLRPSERSIALLLLFRNSPQYYFMFTPRRCSQSKVFNDYSKLRKPPLTIFLYTAPSGKLISRWFTSLGTIIKNKHGVANNYT